MDQVNFYNEEDKVSGSFFDFKEIGDCIEGTLIGKSEKVDNFNEGQMQKVYEIERYYDKSIALIGGRAVIDPQMKNIRIGQIISMKFEGTKPAKRVGYKPTKIIQVYALKNKDKTGPLMNEEWLRGQSDASMAERMATGSFNSNVQSQPAGTISSVNDGNFKETSDGDIVIENVDFNEAPATAPVAPVTNDTNKASLDTIKALAVAKLGCTPEEAIVKAMEATGKAMIQSQYAEIIDILSKM